MPHPVIVCANLKGGSGKTNVSVHLAYLLSQHLRPGQRMTLMDADPNTNAVEWVTKAAPGMDAVNVVKASTNTILRDVLEAQRHGPVIVDTPGNQDGLAQRALLAATLVLVPVNPDPTDLNMLYPMLDLVQAVCDPKGVPWYTVMTRCNEYPAEVRDFRAWLDSQMIPRVKRQPEDDASVPGIEIPKLKLYAQNFGRVPKFQSERKGTDPYVELYQKVIAPFLTPSEVTV